MIRALIFDMGGVLTYDVWENLLLDKHNGVAAIYGLNREQVYIVGLDLWNLFAHKNFPTKNGWKKLENEYWNMFNKKMDLSIPLSNYISLTDKFIKPVKGMRELLKKLKKNKCVLSICSNNTEFWYKRQMNKLNLYPFFNRNMIVLSSKLGVSKSSTSSEMFKAVIHSIGIDKKYCIFIDDKKENIEEALKYGITSIIFPSYSKYGPRYLEYIFKRIGIL